MAKKSPIATRAHTHQFVDSPNPTKFPSSPSGAGASSAGGAGASSAGGDSGFGVSDSAITTAADSALVVSACDDVAASEVNAASAKAATTREMSRWVGRTKRVVTMSAAGLVGGLGWPDARL